MGYLVQTGWKLKKLKHTGTFACIFDRHAKTFATDAGRYVGWGQHSLRFQHITLIQEILATTWTCSRLRLRWMMDKNNPVDNFAPRANLKCFFKTVPFHLALVRWKKQQVGILVKEKHMLEYIRHLEELQIVSMMREFRIVLLRFRILEGGGDWKF
jgi:hypothetical protein